jgi:hypothetical protein
MPSCTKRRGNPDIALLGAFTAMFTILANILFSRCFSAAFVRQTTQRSSLSGLTVCMEY